MGQAYTQTKQKGRRVPSCLNIKSAHQVNILPEIVRLNNRQWLVNRWRITVQVKQQCTRSEVKVGTAKFHCVLLLSSMSVRRRHRNDWDIYQQFMVNSHIIPDDGHTAGLWNTGFELKFDTPDSPRRFKYMYLILTSQNNTSSCYSTN
jgi:hypothetical protein